MEEKWSYQSSLTTEIYMYILIKKFSFVWESQMICAFYKGGNNYNLHLQTIKRYNNSPPIFRV